MTNAAPAGWYPGPDGAQHYWDGAQWVTPGQVHTRVEYVTDEPVNAGTYAPYGGHVRVRPPKSAGVAYVMLLLFGGLAAHRYYLRRPGTALAINALWLGGIVCLIIPGAPGLLMMASAGIWLTVDLFRIPTLVRSASR